MVICCAQFAAAQDSPSTYRLGYQRSQSASSAGQVPVRESAAARTGQARLSLEKPVAGRNARSETRSAADGRSPLPLSPRSGAGGGQPAKPAPHSTANAVGSVVGSLAVVLGLFLAVVWLSRRFSPKGAAPLPKEAVELLGRMTVTPQHTLQLVRVGGRLLLVALSPHGAATLTQISDPAEVERLSALCQRQQPESASASFRDTIRQLERESTTRPLVDERRGAATAAAARTTTRSRA
jgi:flagellar biogenesis protein FliO